MKKTFFLNILSFIILLGLTVSCTSYKKVPYLQGADNKADEVALLSYYKENIVRFKPDDVLGIAVNVIGEQSVAFDYNLPLQPAATMDNSTEDYVNEGVGRQTYMIDKEGFIDFPVLGRLQIAGYTQGELEKYLKQALRKYIKVDPIVTVRLLNFNIKVLGEVASPGEYPIGKDRINVLEALSLAGDMTVYGIREDVKVVRELPSGELQVFSLDVSDINIISSPNFYLQQNDMVYVTPNKAKARSADIGAQTTLIVSGVSVLIALAGFVYSVLQK